MVYIAEKETPPVPVEIVLARDITMSDLARKAGGGFEKKRSGYTLLFTLKDVHESVSPAAIQFTDRDQGGSLAGFWMTEQTGSGTLESSAIIFNPNDGSVTFVDPGSDYSTATGFRISGGLTAVEFSGPRAVFGQDILDAKDRAYDSARELNRRG